MTWAIASGAVEGLVVSVGRLKMEGRGGSCVRTPGMMGLVVEDLGAEGLWSRDSVRDFRSRTAVIEKYSIQDRGYKKIRQAVGEGFHVIGLGLT